MTDPTELAEQLLEALGQVRRQTRRAAGRPWPLRALSPAQVELLRLVRRNEGCAVAEAAAELGLAANTVSTLVTQLADAELIRRVSDERDRRVARLHLTPAARERLAQWRDERSGLVADALTQLSDAQRAALADALPAIAELAANLKTPTAEELHD